VPGYRAVGAQGRSATAPCSMTYAPRVRKCVAKSGGEHLQLLTLIIVSNRPRLNCRGATTDSRAYCRRSMTGPSPLMFVVMRRPAATRGAITSFPIPLPTSAFAGHLDGAAPHPARAVKPRPLADQRARHEPERTEPGAAHGGSQHPTAGAFLS
jgi:hypothetical protein